VLGKQLLRCGTSVAANYRAACRGRSKAEFIARLGIVAEEADESVLWLELLEEANILKYETCGNYERSYRTRGYFLNVIKNCKREQIKSFGFQFTNLPNYPFSNEHFFVFHVFSAGSVARAVRFEE
jgi:four helix bundle protein